MLNIKYNPSFPGKLLYPEIQWRSVCNKVLLTIDDCPNAGLTEQILRVLDDLQIKALFFAIGRNIRQTGNLLREVSSNGHEIGNHSFSHRNLNKLTIAEVHDELKETLDLITKITGTPPRYFRPPYGRFSRRILREAQAGNMQTVLWSLITYDYKNDVNLLKFTFRYLRNDAIVVMHDNVKNASVIRDGIYSLNDYIQRHNFEFGTPHECLK
jgi:peptidoglycan/xylan/chitin deacetylase (PgdA/CDA1 family)